MLVNEMHQPLSVIIVEDQVLLSEQLRYLIEDAGHSVVACAESLAEARALSGIPADVALVDIHLSDGPTGLQVASVMHENNVRVVFMTANVKRIPEDFADAVGVIAKPYTVSGVLAAIDYLYQGVRTPPPKHDLPSGLKLSPTYEEHWR